MRVPAEHFWTPTVAIATEQSRLSLRRIPETSVRVSRNYLFPNDTGNLHHPFTSVSMPGDRIATASSVPRDKSHAISRFLARPFVDE
jgi:hypothetical protein